MFPTQTILQKLRLFIRLLTPMCITQLALLGGSFIAVFLIGQYSTIHLAGVSIGYNIWICIYMFFNGILLGITPIQSQLLGARKTDDMGHIIQQGLFIATVLAVIMYILGYTALVPLLNLLHMDPAAQQVCIYYMKAFSWGLFPILWGCTLRNTIDSHGLTHISMSIVVLSFFLNVCLNYILIFGRFGFPALGGIGAGYAVAISIWNNCILFALVIAFHKKLRGYRVFSHFHGLSWTRIREQIVLGVPIGIAIFLEMSIFSVAGLLMVQFGSAVVAAHQSVISFTNIFYCFPLSVSMAATIAVAYELGAGHEDQAKQYSYLARGIAIVFATLLCTFTFTHMHEIANAFTSDPEVRNRILAFLSYGVCFSVIDAFGTPLQGVLRAYKDVCSISYISIVSYWGVCFPVAYVLIEYADYGPYGIWVGLLSSVLMATVLFTGRTWYIQHKKMA